MATEQLITKIVDGQTPTVQATVERYGIGGALAVTLVGADADNLPGFTMPTADTIVATYPDGDTEVYTYKTGGVSGTTVATITLTFSGGVLQSVVKEVS